MTSDDALVGSVVEPSVDDLGELLFGRRLRLRVLLWAFGQDDVFNQSEAAKGVGYHSSGEVAKELERLVQLEMLVKFGRPSRVGPQNYRRVDHLGWGVADAARRMVEADPSSPQERERGHGRAGLEALEGDGERPQGIEKGGRLDPSS